MKKTLFLSIFLLAAVSGLSAQEKGRWALGPMVNVYANTGVGGVVGIGPVMRYNLLDGLRIEPSVMILTAKGSSVDVACNLHYAFEVARNWYLYPIAGISFNDLYKFAFGFNLGGGFDYSIAYHWDLTLNVKWLGQCASSRRNPIVSTVGLFYKF
ncbi:MAG: outer membrane beta-barrel protein [Alistipes sp.]|nr:outer membrane beta-barrel protein [Alistipes sp.]